MKQGTKIALIVIAIVAGLFLITALLAGWGIYKFTTDVLEETEEAEITTNEVAPGTTEAVVEIVDDVEEEDVDDSAGERGDVNIDDAPLSTPDTSDWLVYENTEENIYFKYPPAFSVEDEVEKIVYPDGSHWYRVTLENGETGAIFYVETNPDGYGPIFADYTLQIATDTDGNAVFMDWTEGDTEYTDDGNVVYTTRYTHPFGHSYFYHYLKQGAEPPEDFDIYRGLVLTSQFND